MVNDVIGEPVLVRLAPIARSALASSMAYAISSLIFGIQAFSHSGRLSVISVTGAPVCRI